jgi:hypothetical protein
MALKRAKCRWPASCLAQTDEHLLGFFTGTAAQQEQLQVIRD